MHGSNWSITSYSQKKNVIRKKTMTYRRNEYLEMMDIFIRCGESLRGKPVSADMSWQADTQPIAMKLFFHLGSLYALQSGTKLPDMAGAPINYVDFPSIATLARAAFETFLAFHFIFVQPTTNEEKHFRYTVWNLGGLKDRQRFMVTTQEGRDLLQQEKLKIEKLEKIIHSSSLYQPLSDARQKDAIKGKWRFGNKWEDLAELTGTHKGYFVSLYAYLSSFAHTGYLSILQLSQAEDQNTQHRLAGIYTNIGLSIMSHFLIAYCSLFAEAQKVLDGNERYNELVQIYFVKAEDWEQFINRA